jgi:triacylglycerol lipase
LNEETILVPGFMDDEEFLALLASSLRREGFNARCISPQPSNGDAPIETLAFQLAEQIATTLPGDQPLNLFGFSMGGLICRVYLQYFGGLARTRRLVTLATPHRGTYMAYLLKRPACYQMRPGSDFLTGLNADLSVLERIAFTSIWTPLDLTIVPAEHSALPVGEMAPILSPFHATLPNDPRIVREITAALRKPVAGSI